jgi:antitoxin MazE
MQVQLSRWGNSLGIRIPRELARKLSLTEGIRVEITEENGRIVIAAARPRFGLADMLQGMTPEAMRDALDWGDDVGHERVGE